MTKINGSAKRIFAILLSVLMVVSYLPMSMIAFAEDTVTEGTDTDRTAQDAVDVSTDVPEGEVADAASPDDGGSEEGGPGQEPGTAVTEDPAVTADEPEVAEAGADEEQDPAVYAVGEADEE